MNIVTKWWLTFMKTDFIMLPSYWLLPGTTFVLPLTNDDTHIDLEYLKGRRFEPTTFCLFIGL